MSATFGSSVSAGFTLVHGGDDDIPPDGSVGYEGSIGMVMGSGDADGNSLSVSLEADIVALGTDTLAQLSAIVQATDFGASGSVSLDVDALALALASDGSAYASAYVWYQVDGDIDQYIATHSASTTIVTQGGTTFVMVSTSDSFFGIDLQDPFAADSGASDSSPASIVPEILLPATLPDSVPELEQGEGGDDCGCSSPPDSFHMSGNLALYDFHLDALGDDSLASLVFDAIAVEDSMSSITAVIVVAVA